jgi:hypothetical protein
VSPEAKDLVKRLLAVDPVLRISWSELNKHPWISGAAAVVPPWPSSSQPTGISRSSSLIAAAAAAAAGGAGSSWSCGGVSAACSSAGAPSCEGAGSNRNIHRSCSGREAEVGSSGGLGPEGELQSIGGDVLVSDVSACDTRSSDDDRSSSSSTRAGSPRGGGPWGGSSRGGAGGDGWDEAGEEGGWGSGVGVRGSGVSMTGQRCHESVRVVIPDLDKGRPWGTGARGQLLQSTNQKIKKIYIIDKLKRKTSSVHFNCKD